MDWVVPRNNENARFLCQFSLANILFLAFMRGALDPRLLRILKVCLISPTAAAVCMLWAFFSIYHFHVEFDIFKLTNWSLLREIVAFEVNLIIFKNETSVFRIILETLRSGWNNFLAWISCFKFIRSSKWTYCLKLKKNSFLKER